MVTLNLTLFVQVVLFLGFLWLMNAHVLQPIIRLIDERAERIQRDKEMAEHLSAAAVQLEREYALAQADMHRKATYEVVQAHRATQLAHNERVAELYRQEEAELSRARADAQAQLDAQLPQIEAQAEELARHIQQTLKLEATGS